MRKANRKPLVGCTWSYACRRMSPTSLSFLSRLVHVHLVVLLVEVVVAGILVHKRRVANLLLGQLHPAVGRDALPHHSPRGGLALDTVGRLHLEVLELHVQTRLLERRQLLGSSRRAQLGVQGPLGTRQQQVAVLGDEFARSQELALAVAGHAALVEVALAAGADLDDLVHGLQGLGGELAVVADGDVAAGGEQQSRVDDHLLARRLAEGLGPLELTRVALHLELERKEILAYRSLLFLKVVPPLSSSLP